MKELMEKWQEYLETDRYTNITQQQQASAMGFGFTSKGTDTFTDFMEWLAAQTNKQ